MTRLIPITLLTGFLGSGKTTILAHVLGRPGFERTCAVINEFGDIDLDHELIEASDDDVILMAKGCLCCTIRGSLADTLRDIVRRQAQGRLGVIDRLVIETTGLADPFPVLQMLSNDPLVVERYWLAGVVCVIDGEQGVGLLAQRLEAVRQVVAADRLIITKSDLSDGDAIVRLEKKLRCQNPGAQIMTAAHGAVPPEFLFADRGGDMATHLQTSAQTPMAGHRDVETFVVGFEAPLSDEGLEAVMQVLRHRAGPRLWRVKGLLWRPEGPPLAVDAAGSRVYPPRAIEHLSSRERVSRLVFIVPPEVGAKIRRELAMLGGHYAAPGAN